MPPSDPRGNIMNMLAALFCTHRDVKVCSIAAKAISAFRPAMDTQLDADKAED